MFDIPQDEMVLTHEQIDSVMQRLDIYISLRHKASQNIYTVSIKGFERSVGRCLVDIYFFLCVYLWNNS